MPKIVRAARHYQRKDSAVRLLGQHAKSGIKRDIKASLKHLASIVPTERALQLAHNGNYQHIQHVIAWGHFREVLKAPFGRITKLRHAAGALGVQKINGAFAQARRQVRFRKDIGGRFNFDPADQATLDRIRQAQDDLIQQLEDGARDTIEQIIISGLRDGLGPTDIVDDIRSMIGLTDTQAQAVLNYRNMLENLDSGALSRQLRNTEFDAAVSDAINSGDDLASAVVDQMVSDYEDNYLDYRAGMIAQTESVRAANAGLQDSYRQAIDRGALPTEAVTQFWQVALDERTCEVCLSIPDQNPDGVGMGETFDSIDGPMDAPPDPHPNCRCSIEIVTDLDKVPDDAEF